MYMFTLSTGYLKYLELESRYYTFNFQGYSNLVDANEGLLKISVSELHGFCIVLDGLPENPQGLREFINRCNLMCSGLKSPMRMVISLPDDTSLLPFMRQCDTNNLEVFSAEFDIMTDLFIKQQIFGTILDGSLTAYGGSKRAKEYKLGAGLNTLKLVHPFNPLMLETLSPLVVRDSLNSTLVEDSVLTRLSEISEFYKSVRLYMINCYFGKGDVYFEKVEELLADIKDPNEKMKCKLFVNYVSCEWRMKNVGFKSQRL